MRASGKLSHRFGEYQLGRMVPIFLIHLGAAIAFFIDSGWQVWAVCLALYWTHMFAVTAGYHRYFSHRTYKTSRIMQFALAWWAQSSSQQGVLWWAAHHRTHHKYSDTEHDVHSPKQAGFWHAHMGWLYDRNGGTNYQQVKDLSRYPELVLLNKLWWLPPVALAVTITAIWGWPGLVVGYLLSTVLAWHATFTVNSLAHVWGNRRYETTDTSRNNWVIALLTMGEGWHNNHHHYMGSTRQGFFWWEIDATYLILKAMSWVGLVWDLKKPPQRVYETTKLLPIVPEAA